MEVTLHCFNRLHLLFIRSSIFLIFTYVKKMFLSRWTVIFHPNEKETDETRVKIQNETESANLEDQTSIFVMNNYFGIGIDADLSLDFHNAREDKPDKFNSRYMNRRSLKLI